MCTKVIVDVECDGEYCMEDCFYLDYTWPDDRGNALCTLWDAHTTKCDQSERPKRCPACIEREIKPTQSHPTKKPTGWMDLNGRFIYEGDTMEHPNGDAFTVVWDPTKTNPFRAVYSDGASLWLGHQIGSRGGAVVKPTQPRPTD